MNSTANKQRTATKIPRHRSRLTRNRGAHYAAPRLDYVVVATADATNRTVDTTTLTTDAT